MVKHSYLIGCHFEPRSNDGPLFSDGGDLCVNLRGYAVIPMEQYERYVELAEAQASALAKDVLSRAAIR